MNWIVEVTKTDKTTEEFEVDGQKLNDAFHSALMWCHEHKIAAEDIKSIKLIKQ